MRYEKLKVGELMGRELEKFGDMGKEKEGTAINVEHFLEWRKDL